MDIARLGYAVDSQPLKRATRDLDKMGGASARAERATRDFGRTSSASFTRSAASAARLAAVVAGSAGLTVGFGSLTVAISGSIRAFAQLERVQSTTQQLLRTTGGAAGQTLATIEELSRDIGINTLASTREVREAANTLLTFRSISGEVFEDTLRLAQDLAASGFGNLSSSAVQLAKALEDPAINLTNLRRVGVSFSQDQIELIKRLDRTGRRFEAQQEIIAAVAAQVGGAGEAAASGTLSGAYDTFNEQLSISFERLGGNIVRMTRLTEVVNLLADALGQINEAAEGQGQLNALNDEIRLLEQVGIGPIVERRIAALKRERELLRDLLEPGHSAADFGDMPVIGEGRFERNLGLPDIDSLKLTNEELEEYFRKAGRLPQSMEEIEKAARTAEGALAQAEDRIRELGLEAQAASGTITSVDAAVMNMEVSLRAAGVSGQALTTTLADYRVALEQAETANARAKEQRKLSADAIRQENEAAREAVRTVNEIANRATGALGDIFYDSLRGEHTDFLQFFEDTFLRTVADLAAEAAKNAIIVPIVTQAVQGAPGLFGVSRAGAAGLEGGAGQAAGGFFSGLGRLFGGGASAAGASGAAGAAAGAASIASIASVALPIAAVAAPLAMGLLRRRDDPDPMSRATGRITADGLSIMGQTARDGGDVERSLGVLRSVEQGVMDITDAVGTFQGALDVTARVVEETGEITVEAAGQVGTFKEETEAALFAVQALAGGMHGLSPAMEAATRGADSVQEAVQQIEQLEEFQRIGVTFNEIETQASEINDTFAALSETAEDLGFAQARLADIERDRVRAIGLLRAELEQDLALQLAELENGAAAQIAAIRRAQAEQLRAASAVGVDLVNVERVFGAERLAVVQDFSDQQLRALLNAGPLDRALSQFETARRGVLDEV
ncbi:MAG: hypothetical protein MI753_06305, partial [Hyphomicrobiales bacterium]|nr:hypothetical protein [Hyphomicrobiales bacterium]